MPTLVRRVGLGLASRGKVSDCVAWAERARAAGLDSVWFHDSYFERDAVTYASAVASQVPELGVGSASAWARRSRSGSARWGSRTRPTTPRRAR